MNSIVIVFVAIGEQNRFAINDETVKLTTGKGESRYREGNAQSFQAI